MNVEEVSDTGTITNIWDSGQGRASVCSFIYVS